MNIFVARLDYATQSEDLREVFEEFGAVSSAKVIYDRYTGNSRGFGFVEMDNDQSAMDAIQELDGTQLDGRNIVVKKAKPRGRDRGNNSSAYDNSGSSYSNSNSYNRW